MLPGCLLQASHSTPLDMVCEAQRLLVEHAQAGVRADVQQLSQCWGNSGLLTVLWLSCSSTWTFGMGGCAAGKTIWAVVA